MESSAPLGAKFGGLTVKHIPAIELKHLTKRFGKIVANEDISLSIREGEILAILGENGSGKTTLMNICLLYTSFS